MALRYLSSFLLGAQVCAGYSQNAYDSPATVARSLPEQPILLSRRDLSSCPGYTLSGVTKTSNSINAALKLAGPACNANGNDLDNLRLLVEYQTGKEL